MSFRSKTLRNTVAASVGIYVEYFLGMVAAVLIARHLGPRDYGLYGLIMWMALAGTVFTNAGITTGVIKFVAEFRGAQRESLIAPFLAHMWRVQVLHLVAVLAGAVLLLALFGQELVGELNLTAIAMLVVAVGLRASYLFHIAVAKGFEAFGVTAKVSMVSGPLNLLMVAGAVWLDASIEWLLAIYVASSSVFFLISRFLARRLVTVAPEPVRLPPDLRARIRHHLRFVSVTVIVSFVIASDVELLFLKVYGNAVLVGYLKVAFLLARGMTSLVPGVISAVLLPMMAVALSQSRELAGERFVSMTFYMVVVAAPLTAFGMAFAAPLIELLYGSAYDPAAPIFAICILATNFAMVAQGASSLLMSADRQHVILILVISFGVLKIVLDVLLISQFGLPGAVGAILIASVTSTIAFVAAATRISGVTLEYARMLRTVLASAGAAIIASSVLLLHAAPAVELLLGGIVLVGAYLMLTLVLRCWSRADIDQLRGLHRRFARGRPRALDHMLGWFAARAGRQP